MLILLTGINTSCTLIYLFKYKILQVLSSFHWLKFQKLEVDWVTVTDDDCLMNVQNVYNSFKAIKVSENENKIFCGFKRTENAEPVRDKSSRYKKWYN